MNPDKGIYALVIPLDAEQSIAIGRNGTRHVFPQGWYVYVGSARGPGGLQSHTGQYRRCQADGKRMHWNVDWFREFAPIREIWYSRTDCSCREHDWARTRFPYRDSVQRTVRSAVEPTSFISRGGRIQRSSVHA